MVIKESRPFAYGRFVAVSPHQFAFTPLPERTPSVAIEILREFSATELVGKVYVKGTAAGWEPVDPSALADYEWYKDFKEKGWRLLFDMKPSGRWDVLNFRIESDERGPYVAVALKYDSQK
jgi:hypothetical protein